jgi:hypothetical protein
LQDRMCHINLMASYLPNKYVKSATKYLGDAG